MGIYYMTYILGNPALLGTFSMASMFPMIIGLAFTPALVKKMKGMYKVNLYGYCFASVSYTHLVAAYANHIKIVIKMEFLPEITAPFAGIV